MIDMKQSMALMKELAVQDLTDEQRLALFCDRLGYTTSESTDEERVSGYERLAADMARTFDAGDADAV